MKILKPMFGLLIVTMGLNAQALPTLAVLDFEAIGMPEIEVLTLTDRLRHELTKTSSENVMRRETMQPLIAGQECLKGENITDECAVEAGKLLGATYIVTGTIKREGSSYTVEMKILDVSTGESRGSLTRDYQGEIDGMISLINSMSPEVIDRLK